MNSLHCCTEKMSLHNFALLGTIRGADFNALSHQSNEHVGGVDGVDEESVCCAVPGRAAVVADITGEPQAGVYPALSNGLPIITRFYAGTAGRTAASTAGEFRARHSSHRLYGLFRPLVFVE